MQPARTYPDRRDDVRLLVVDPAARAVAETRTPELPALLSPGDLLVVNDAATLPGSLRGHDPASGQPIEVRLLSTSEAPLRDGRFLAVLFGAGDWRARTEDRPPPPPLEPGARLSFGALGAVVVARAPLSPRLVELAFDARGDQLWAALYREGRPVQYSYLAHELPLWAVQNSYAARPWAFEMPSAGRSLSWEILLELRRRGVRWAALTHAAGLSATGDPAIDAALPLPERYQIPPATARAVAETRAAGGRVIAVGTTVVRALEGSGGAAGSGVTDLRLDAAYRPRVVGGVLAGVHAAEESHFALLGAFAGRDLLAEAVALAEARGFRTHELGDAMLVLPGAQGRMRAPVDQTYAGPGRSQVVSQASRPPSSS
jgi:S-adenosylmethionine:tRNA ribosyltransferase-isomerase